MYMIHKLVEIPQSRAASVLFGRCADFIEDLSTILFGQANLHKALREVDAQRVRSEMDRTLLVKDIELLLRTLNAAGLSDPRVR